MDINEAIREVIELTRGEAAKHGASVQTALGEGLPAIEGDRVQLQQVILNLIVNAVQAMGTVEEGPRELFITTARAEPNGVLVAVKDFGTRRGPVESRATLRPLLHDEGRWPGHGAVDLPFDHRSAWRAVVVTANQPGAPFSASRCPPTRAAHRDLGTATVGSRPGKARSVLGVATAAGRAIGAILLDPLLQHA